MTDEYAETGVTVNVKGPERGNEFGKLVCEAIGVPPEIVRSVTVTADATDVLRVTFVCYARLSKSPELGDMLRTLTDAEKVVSVEFHAPTYEVTNMASTAREYISDVG